MGIGYNNIIYHKDRRHSKMASQLQSPRKEVDVDFLVFVERNATDLLTLDILTFFGHNPAFTGTVEHVAQQLGRSSQSIRAELGDLALKEILSKVDMVDGQVAYQLAPKNQIKRMVVKLASSQSVI
jgi:hypothetical protein